MQKRQGFTILEILIVMSIIAIISVVGFLNLQGGKSSDDLIGAAKQVGVLLREAQSDSMAQEQDASWGVYFSNVTSTAPFYALFTNTYSTSSVQGRYRLPATVGYASSFLASGATTSITFASISGMASASARIQLYLLAQPSLSSTVTVTPFGAVSY